MDKPPRHLYEFGAFRLDPGAHLLLCHDVPVSLPPKAFDTLVLLVQQSGRLVRKEEFLRTIWPGSFVEENNLTQCISLLRKALANGEGSPVIETVPRLGYRFVAEVKSVADGDSEKTLRSGAAADAVFHDEETGEAGDSRESQGEASTSSRSV